MNIRLLYPPAPPAIQAILSAVRDRSGLHRSMSYDLAAMVAGHIRRASATRHASANRLGAAPTGHLEAAARSVAPVSDGLEIAATVDSPGFRRVDGPLEIKAKNTPNLTIPVHAVAYGRRVWQVRNLLGTPIFRPLAPGGQRGRGPYRNFLAAQVRGEFRILYALKPSVTLPQDLGLLPSESEFGDRMTQALRRYLRSKIKMEAGA